MNKITKNYHIVESNLDPEDIAEEPNLKPDLTNTVVREASEALKMSKTMYSMAMTTSIRLFSVVLFLLEERNLG